jgi:hypothetical protein
VTIPDSVTSIGDSAFYYCTALTSVTIPDSVTSIGDSAFYYCTALTSVTIPDSVTSIGRAAFAHCSSFTALALPASVTSFDLRGDDDMVREGLEGCVSLARIDVDADNTVYASIDGVLFSKSLTRLLRCPPGKEGVYAVTAGVHFIADLAFYHCALLTELVLPNTLLVPGSLFFGGIYDEVTDTYWPIEIPISARLTALAEDDAFIEAVANRILAKLPDNYGIATKDDVGIAVSSATAQAIAEVQATPNNYNLYSSTQYQANYSNGVTAGTSLVTANPTSYNLYTADSIMDMNMGGLMIQRHGGNATVVFQPQTTTNLKTQPFTNNGTPITNTIPMPGNTGFIRINAKPNPTPVVN